MENSAYLSETVPAEVQTSCFRGSSGVAECHVLVRPVESAGVEQQLHWITQAYRGVLANLGFGSDTALFRRFSCRDLVSQVPALGACRLSSRAAPDEPCAISWVCQPPMPPAKIALWAYHVSDPAAALDKRLGGATLIWNRNRLSHQWTTGICCPAPRTSEEQTRRVLQSYAALLSARNLSLADHVIRTWFFVKDIGVNYEGMVVGRREFFRAHGLTPDTHFIASTGIEGSGPDPGGLVMLDALAIGGVQPNQITFLAAPDHMCPTHAYGVTFERATQIAYRDRAHILVSGTASIDARGGILHAGDLARQLDRSLDNIDALLRSVGATLQDMAMLIAYVRESADQEPVRERVRQRCPGVPIQVVVAAICRPDWLLEVEGMGIVDTARPDLPAF